MDDFDLKLVISVQINKKGGTKEKEKLDFEVKFHVCRNLPKNFPQTRHNATRTRVPYYP